MFNKLEVDVALQLKFIMECNPKASFAVVANVSAGHYYNSSAGQIFAGAARLQTRPGTLNRPRLNLRSRLHEAAKAARASRCEQAHFTSG